MKTISYYLYNEKGVLITYGQEVPANHGGNYMRKLTELARKITKLGGNPDRLTVIDTSPKQFCFADDRNGGRWVLFN